jgi:hypothetical protein
MFFLLRKVSLADIREGNRVWEEVIATYAGGVFSDAIEFLVFIVVAAGIACLIFSSTKKFSYAAVVGATVAVCVENHYHPDPFFILAVVPMWCIALAISGAAVWLMNRYMKKLGYWNGEEGIAIRYTRLWVSQLHRSMVAFLRQLKW